MEINSFKIDNMVIDLYPSLKPKGNIILCHGLFGNSRWGFLPYIATKLMSEFNVYLINFSKNGFDTQENQFKYFEDFSLNTYSQEIIDLGILVDAIHNGRTKNEKLENDIPLYIIGHSKGGAVALLYSIDHQDKISGVIGLNTTTNVQFFPEELIDIILNEGTLALTDPRSGIEFTFSKEILIDIEDNKDKYDVATRLIDMKKPVLLLQGANDHPILVSGFKTIIDCYPFIEYGFLEKSDHCFNSTFPFNGGTDQLDEVILKISRFINRQNKGITT